MTRLLLSAAAILTLAGCMPSEEELAFQAARTCNSYGYNPTMPAWQTCMQGAYSAVKADAEREQREGWLVAGALTAGAVVGAAAMSDSYYAPPPNYSTSRHTYLINGRYFSCTTKTYHSTGRQQTTCI